MSNDYISVSLRQRAEALMQKEIRSFSSMSVEEMQAIMHDLNVHQIELEMQNDQLKLTYEGLQESKNAFANLFEHAPIGYIRLDDVGSILQSNQTIQQLLGYSEAEMNGKYLAKFIHPEDLGIYTARFNAFRNRPENKVLELRLTKKNAEIIDVEIKGRSVDKSLFETDKQTIRFGRPIKSNDNSLLISLSEVSTRKRMEDELKLAAKVFDSSEEGIMIVDPNNKILKVNLSFTAVTGYKAQEVIGKTPRILKSGRQSREFYVDMWHQLTREGHWQGEIWNRRKNGDLYAEWLSITNVQDKYGKVTHYIGIFSDITLRKLNEQEVEKLANYDVLTELPNRALLNDRLKQAVVQATRHKHCLSVLFLDLDRFKTLNDTLGHFIGDMLLQDVSKRLLSCVRESDTVARFGGDEFVIVLTDFKDEESATIRSAEIAKKILTALSSPFELKENRFVTSTSIGFAVFPKDGQSVTELIKNADTAMYHAKDQGRNNFQYFSTSMRDDNLKRSLLVTDVHDAMIKSQFMVYYQPKVDLQDGGKTIGFEALARWQHPKKGFITPEDFIPVAEESGVIIELGTWILRTACQQLKRWHNAGHTDLSMSVNLSARQFVQNDLVETVKSVLKQTELDARFLDLEITESVMMKNMTEASNILKKLVRMGCTVSLDDFGTGYSSLTYLKKFPVHCIKIDRSFVRDIITNPDDKVIVKSIISIAKHMHIKVVAEGIETEEQVNYLIKQGCEMGQGYFYSEAVPAKEVTERL